MPKKVELTPEKCELTRKKSEATPKKVELTPKKVEAAWLKWIKVDDFKESPDKQKVYRELSLHTR